ncbi:MAG: AMP-binding protein [Pseudomonadota bacterium]
MNSVNCSGVTQRAGITTVGGLFSARSATQPNRTAVREGKNVLTYGELEARSTALAHWFLGQGMEQGDRVAVHLHNCTAYLEIELAAAKAGLIVAALNWRLSAQELTHCINLVEPRLIIEGPDSAAILDDCTIGQTPRLLLADVQKRVGANPNHAALPPLADPEAGLVILYTSGTTGLPKGALISHRAMVARMAAFNLDLHLPPVVDFLAWAPLFHMASTDHALATLLQGGAVHIVDGYQPQAMLDVIENHALGWLVLMPGMIADFASHAVARGTKPKGITAMGAMADLVPRAELAAVTSALNTPYLNTFGATETGLPPATGNVVPVGVAPTDLRKRQSSLCQVKLVDPDDNEVPDGTPGEVAVRGPTVFSGYWNAHDTNAHDFRGGWFHMGDVMRRNEDGTLSYVDRVKYMIKSGGENIYPAEIEAVIQDLEAVETATVVRQKSVRWGEEPVAFIVLKKGMALTADTILTHCENTMARYKLPKAIHFIGDADLPRSATGKIQRHVLEERLDKTV